MLQEKTRLEQQVINLENNQKPLQATIEQLQDDNLNSIKSTISSYIPTQQENIDLRKHLEDSNLQVLEFQNKLQKANLDIDNLKIINNQKELRINALSVEKEDLARAVRLNEIRNKMEAARIVFEASRKR